MGSRTHDGRFLCSVLVALIVLASLVTGFPAPVRVWANHGDIAPALLVVLYTSTPTDLKSPSPTFTTTRTASPKPTVTRSGAPSITPRLSVTPTPTRLLSATYTPSPRAGAPTGTLTASTTFTATRTLTGTPTSTATPPLGAIQLPIFLSERELIINGTFESGQLEPYWTSAGHLRRKVVSTVRHGGLYSVLLGDPAYASDGGCPAGAAAIYQVVEVPRSGQVTLRFWYLIQSYDTKQFDYLAVIVAPTPDLDAEPIFVQGRTYWDEWLWSSGWREAKISLSTFKGEKVYIMLCNVMGNEDGWYNTWTYIDDVRIEYRPQ